MLPGTVERRSPLRCRLNTHMPRPQHILTEIDEEARTATCIVCGPGTKMWKGGTARKRWRCSTIVKAQVSRQRKLDPVKERVRKMRGNGVEITLEQFVALVEAADGRCGLCGVEGKALHVDHDHETGAVRGLLCSTCNTGLGKFGDDPDRLREAADYLERSYISN